MRRGVLIAGMGLIGLLAPGAMAEPDGGGLRQAAARQEQIRAEARDLVGRLDDVLAEYQRNGLAA